MEESQTYLIFVRGLDFKSCLGTFVGVVLTPYLVRSRNKERFESHKKKVMLKLKYTLLQHQ